MDKFELEGQILSVLDSEDWMTVKEVHAQVCDTYGCNPNATNVKRRLESLVKFHEVESRMQKIKSYKQAQYKRASA